MDSEAHKIFVLFCIVGIIGINQEYENSRLDFISSFDYMVLLQIVPPCVTSSYYGMYMLLVKYGNFYRIVLIHSSPFFIPFSS
jgi:hypothetical protein